MTVARRLQNKIALITGAASGIGRETAQRFLEEGALVAVTDISEQGINAFAAAADGRVLALRLDVTSETAWKGAVQQVIAHFGRLDIVANIAGIGVGGSIEEFDLAGFEKMVAVNLVGVMLGCKHGIGGIVRSGGAGAIINMSSMAGIAPPADLPGYAATKGGVTTLTRSVALHCASKGYPVRCVSIHPTYVDTAMLDPVAAASGLEHGEFVAQLAKQVPVGRIASPRDVANGILFAASEEAAMISGSGLILDGAQIAGPASAHFAE